MKILKFGAIWCTECLVMKPMWKEIEESHPALKTEYFDLDQAKEEKERWNINKAPTFIFLDKDGKEFLRLTGVQNKKDLIKIVEENINR